MQDFFAHCLQLKLDETYYVCSSYVRPINYCVSQPGIGRINQ